MGDRFWGTTGVSRRRPVPSTVGSSLNTQHPTPNTYAGMALKEAESRWPDVAYRADAPAEYARALEAVLDLLAEHSPIVEWSAEPDRATVTVRHDPMVRYAIFLDGTGLAALYGSEERLGHLILRAVQEQVGHCAAVGIADGRYAALHSALLASRTRTTDQSPEAPHVVPAGGDAAFLAPLPVNLLPLPPEARVHVARLGVRTLREFSRLPVNSVRLRLGPDGVLARGLAAGRDEGLLRARSTPLLLRDTIEFEWLEMGLDRLLFLFKRLADRLSTRLAYHGLGCGRLRVTWLLDAAGLTTGDDVIDTAADGPAPIPAERSGSGGITATIRLAEPAGSGEALREHLRWHAEGLRPETFRDPTTGQCRGVRGIVVEAEELAPLGGHQLTLLPGERGWTSQPERQLAAQRALARLQARWGEGAVQRDEPLTLLQRLDQQHGAPIVVDTPPSSIWLHHQPREVEIHRAIRLPNGRRRRGAIIQGNRKRRVINAAAPRRRVEHWGAAPVKQDTYHVVLADGSAYRLVYDQTGDRWYVLGTFD
jgi:hypothetical protein